MKKSLLKGLSVCLVLICILSMLLSPSVNAISKSISKEKINPRLSEVLSETDSKDTVQVSIWFDDIDQDGIIDKTKQSFVKAKSRSSSDTSAIEILDIDTDVDSIDAFRDDTYAGDVQEIIEIKRSYLASAYKDYNNQQKEKIIDKLSLPEKILFM